jgi:hypothetical protein
VTNGAGYDAVELGDLNVGGSVTVRNGRAEGGALGGPTFIYNDHNPAARSLIRGSVSVSYLDGAGSAALYDVDVGGNVTCSFGSGPGHVILDGYRTTLPTQVGGDLTVTGTGGLQIRVGTSYARTGAVVGGSVRVTGGAGADTLDLYRLAVGGTTTLALGGGANAVTVNDSVFGGAVALTTGAGADTVNLDPAAGTAAATVFRRPVKLSLGAGVDAVTLGGPVDPNQAVVFAAGCRVRHGAEGESAIRYGKDYYPFGGGLLWLV